MSDEKKPTPEVPEDTTPSQEVESTPIEEELPPPTEEQETVPEEEEESPKYTEAQIKHLEEEVAALDRGELPLHNQERMEALLTYLIDQDQYTGEYNPTVTVKLVETMIADIQEVEKLPDTSIASISYTPDELETISKRLLRLIQANQHKRAQLSVKEINEQFVHLKDERLILTHEENYLLSYISSAMAMADHSPVAKSLKEGSWTNLLEHNGRRIGSALVVNHKDPIKQIRSKLNLMNESTAQLVHSGLVLKLSSSSSLDQALLNDNMVASKIQNSLMSFGTGLDSTSIYINELLVEHAYRQIVESNIGDMSKETFEDNLSVLDLDTLYNAMAISLFPTGFKLYRQCMSEACKTVDEITINPRRCIIYREDRLSNAAKAHLTRYFTRGDISHIKEYQSELNPEVSKYCEIMDDTYIKFKVPSFSEYKRIAKGWMSYLGEKSLELMRGSKDEDSRRRYIQQSMEKSAVMMYSHWIEGIYSKDENGDYIPSLVRLQPGRGITTNSISVADEKLNEFLSDLSLNTEIHSKLLSAVTDFIRDSSLVVIAMVKTRCSKCGDKHHPEGEETQDELISFNVGELFFTLLHRRIAGQ